MKIKYYLIVGFLLASCNKNNFLDKKPTTGITTPTTLSDFQLLLDNTAVMGFTSGLPQTGSDDYFVSYDDYKIASTPERNSYIWAKKIYGGEVDIQDWNALYKQILYANTVIEGLDMSNEKTTSQGQYLYGWALFYRAYAYYDLTRTFCKAYDESSANSDLGVPIRLSGEIDRLQKRPTLQKTFDRIFADLIVAEKLLPPEKTSLNPNRPSKVAVYALLARIYLDMRNYTKAEENSEKALALYNKLIDFNTLSTTTRNPFSDTNDEIIFASNTVIAYGYLNGTYQYSSAKVAPELYSLYSINDLRRTFYFIEYGDGTYNKRRMGSTGIYPYTGLSTNEMYLIKAECLARRNSWAEAMNVLNSLLVTRYSKEAPYTPPAVTNSQEALSVILLERRKDLIWRGLRWHDLKRLNKEGAGISLTRKIDGTTYTLPPNDPKWVFPIPDDEIAISGIQQNMR